MIASGILTKFLLENPILDHDFNNNAIWNVSQTIGGFVLFAAVLYEEEKSVEPGLSPRAPESVEITSMDHADSIRDSHDPQSYIKTIVDIHELESRLERTVHDKASL
eukprot:TRINITY_DN9984_c0_g1_i1.p1 TRINITY_DN9984_c0_g1~~TRINITY_DN9984_c0_g1_i1.p1  ORF type:complete len:121 (-),score=6.12 TRINITY_DN9984_c0_g1_i1:172-492(-)